MPVCSGHDERHRDATTIHQQMAFAPIFPPISGIGSNALLSQWRLHHRLVNALASPRNAFKFVVLGKSLFPQSFKEACFLPLKKSGVYCASTAVALCGQGFPLDACSQYVDDAFKYESRVFGLASTASLSTVGLICYTLAQRNQWLYSLPKFVGNFPCFRFEV